jgi:hypothetical protein
VATGRVLDFGFEGAWLQPRRNPDKINLRLLAAEENRSPQCAFFAAYEVATDTNPKKYGAPLQGLKSPFIYWPRSGAAGSRALSKHSS